MPSHSDTQTAGRDTTLRRVLAAADTAASGIGLVYRALSTLVTDRGLVDALVIIDEAPLGRQAFLAGRRVPDTTWARWHVAHARPGVHTSPLLLDDGGELDALDAVCRMALRLDLARYDAQHDPLTGLRNRRSFEEALARAVSRSQRYGWPFTLVLLDLDDFKRLNDRLGHDAGDAVLRAVGEVARHNLRQGDVAARLGGDEFSFVLPSGGADANFVPGLIARLQAGLDELSPTPVRFSVGVAVCPTDAADADTLCKIADERLYAAKRPRRDR